MKILNSIFWFMLGTTFASLVINSQVIGANVGDMTSAAGIAVYNLHDVLLPYVIFYIAGTALALLAILVKKYFFNSGN